MTDVTVQLQVREALKDVFREAEQRGLNQATLARRCGFSPGALHSWANGNSDMDLWRFVRLCRELPDDIASHVFECIDKAIRTVKGDGCFDDLAAACAEYQIGHLTARNDDSPGGPAIVHSESGVLVKSARKVRAAADHVIAKHGGQ